MNQDALEEELSRLGLTQPALESGSKLSKGNSIDVIIEDHPLLHFLLFPHCNTTKSFALSPDLKVGELHEKIATLLAKSVDFSSPGILNHPRTLFFLIFLSLARNLNLNIFPTTF